MLKKQKTIEELLKQTRPVTKGPRVRGKSKKCRGSKKPSATFSCFNGDRLSALASLGASRSSATAMQAQAMAQAQAQYNQVSFLRAKYAGSKAAGAQGNLGGLAGPALGAAF